MDDTQTTTTQPVSDTPAPVANDTSVNSLTPNTPAPDHLQEHEIVHLNKIHDIATHLLEKIRSLGISDELHYAEDHLKMAVHWVEDHLGIPH